jgi:hypothetical protein
MWAQDGAVYGFDLGKTRREIFLEQRLDRWNRLDRVLQIRRLAHGLGCVLATETVIASEAKHRFRRAKREQVASSLCVLGPATPHGRLIGL